MSIDEISRVLNADPEASFRPGESRPDGSIAAKACWQASVPLELELWGGTYGLDEALQRLEGGYADGFSQLVGAGCDVVLQVQQGLEDDSVTHGIHMSPPAVQWLARAKAALDIEQWVLVEQVE